MEVTVLRLGHRPLRDKRITTHVALTARAFGAKSIIITQDDPHLKESVEDVVERWGGDFSIEFNKDWKSLITNWQGVKVHLTMYGMKLGEGISRIKEQDKALLLIVGAEKVPGIVYQLADYNLSVGNQPHSEVSALALFLDRLYEGRPIEQESPEGKIRITPSRDSKKVISDD